MTGNPDDAVVARFCGMPPLIIGLVYLGRLIVCDGSDGAPPPPPPDELLLDVGVVGVVGVEGDSALALTVIEISLLALFPSESVTVIVTEYVPTAVGFPERVNVASLELEVTPSGRVLTSHLSYVSLPPVAVAVPERSSPKVKVVVPEYVIVGVTFWVVKVEVVLLYVVPE